MRCCSHPIWLPSASLELRCRGTPGVSQAALDVLRSGPRASAPPVARRQPWGLSGASHGRRERAEGDGEQAATERLPRASGELAHVRKPATRRHCDREKQEATRRRRKCRRLCQRALGQVRVAHGQGQATNPSGLGRERNPRAALAFRGVLSSDDSTERTLGLESDWCSCRRRREHCNPDTAGQHDEDGNHAQKLT